MNVNNTIQSSKPNLNLIQVLRGIASLLVVFFHATVNEMALLGKDFCLGFFSFGKAGVDIFFVLSGFIITYTSFQALKASGKPIPFLRRRFIRIFPAYWIVITIFLVIQSLFSSFYNSGTYNYSVSNIVATYFLLPGHLMVNGVSWTLSYELFFYILFSVAFIIPSKKLVFILGLVYACIIIILAIINYPVNVQNTWTLFFIFPMNTEFLMGVIAALIIPKIPSGISMGLIISGSLLFLAGAVLYNNHYYVVENEFNRVITFGVPSFLIITGVVKFELGYKVKVHNFLLALGEASYSLYLIHLPLVVAAIKLIGKMGITNNIIIHCLLLLVILIICCISVFFFRHIEKPIINKLNAFGKTIFTQ
ncbi:acyltransferase family protein [Ferruginibacter sp. SUN106]|uniref:acyltransferase family protein n=1 Tax=Ferruginibacter sp. SUN106 TaxID=2978348 RepID=UPI003D361F67